MAKLRGEQRWKHQDVYTELMSLEIKLDSLHQKALKNGKVTISEEMISKMLGKVRSIQTFVGHEQKTLKRWTRPAPNQPKLSKQFDRNR